MEQDNELRQTQNPSSESGMQARDKQGVDTGAASQNLEILVQKLMAGLEEKIDKKLAELTPKPTQPVDAVDTAQQNEYMLMKSKLEEMEKVQKSLVHHDFGSGQINSRPSIDRNKTLREHLDEDSRRGESWL